ncbi:MAG TPA: hypothetical protein PKE55_05925 [Kiritimatiellia bacterium]|nr:hypothetical protein [Kiritimatiellia bacterium]
MEAIRSGDSEQVGLPVAVAAAGEDEAVRVIAVDRELDIVALSGGSRQHLRAGMNGALVRDGRVIARIRLVDVRRDVSGAVVTRRWSGVDPEPGDRWLLGR